MRKDRKAELEKGLSEEGYQFIIHEQSRHRGYYVVLLAASHNHMNEIFRVFHSLGAKNIRAVVTDASDDVTVDLQF